MTPEVAMKLGKVAAIVLGSGSKRAKFVIGKDTRLSGYMIENALTSGILSAGGDVLLVGPMPTPAVAHLTRSFAADAGIAVTATHNHQPQPQIRPSITRFNGRFSRCRCEHTARVILTGLKRFS